MGGNHLASYQYSLCGLFGCENGLGPGETPPIPLQAAPSPRSESNGERSPSAMARAKHGDTGRALPSHRGAQLDAISSHGYRPATVAT